MALLLVNRSSSVTCPTTPLPRAAGGFLIVRHRTIFSISIKI
jgi:hypothetical protein